MIREHFIFRTWTGKEADTARILRDYGYDATINMTRERKRAHRKHKVKSVPVMEPVAAYKGYVRVRLPDLQAWAGLHLVPVQMWRPGAPGKQPVPMSHEDARQFLYPPREMFSDLDNVQAIKVTEQEHEYTVGEVVTVYGAGFDGCKGPVTNTDKEGTVRVLLPLLNSKFEIEFDVDSVVRAA